MFPAEPTLTFAELYWKSIRFCEFSFLQPFSFAFRTTLFTDSHTLYQRKYWSAIILPALQLINSRDWLKSIAVHWVHSFALIIIIRYKKMTITDSQPTSTCTPVICEKRNHINTDSGIPDIAACCRTHHSQTYPTNPCWYFGTTWNALKLNEWLQHTFIADSFLFPDIHIPSCYL